MWQAVSSDLPSLVLPLTLRCEGARLVMFALPLMVTTLLSFVFTWQDPIQLCKLLVVGGLIGVPLFWWAAAHRVILSLDHVHHRLPLSSGEQATLSSLREVDIRPSDRRWPFRAYQLVVTCATGQELRIETANFSLSDVHYFLRALLSRAPQAVPSARVYSFLQHGA